MTVSLSPVGGAAQQFFDNNGQPLSGGKIYTYAAGTTTPQPSYTNSNGFTPHANPIVLDSAGRVPGGEIWLTDGLQYKFVVETSTAILIGTYDNISGINSNFINYTAQEEVITATAGQTVFNLSTVTYAPGTNSLSVYIDGVNQYVGDSYSETDSNTVTFSSGLHAGAEVKFTTTLQTSTAVVDAGNVIYDAPYANSVSSTVEAKLSQVISVTDFGAVGDGVANDTVAIQNAIDACAAILHTVNGLTLSVALHIPAGTYLVDGVDVIQPLAIIGDGIAATRLLQTPNTIEDVITVTNVDHFSMSGVCVDGNFPNQGLHTGFNNGIFLNECFETSLSDCEFRYCAGNGMRSFGGARLSMVNCVFRNNDENGTYHTTTAVALDDGTHYVRVVNCVAFQNNYDGFCFDPGSAACTVTNCVSYENAGTGFNTFGNSSGIFPREVAYANCISRLNELEGFSCHGARNVTYTGCQSHLDGQINTGLRINGFIIQNDFVGQYETSNVVVSNCLIVAPRGHGIYVGSVDVPVASVVIDGCVIQNVGNNASNTYDGIYLSEVTDAKVLNTVIQDNQAPNLMRHAITTTATALNAQILNCSVENGLSGAFNVDPTTLIVGQLNDELFIKTPQLAYDKGIFTSGNPRPRHTLAPDGITAQAHFYARDSVFERSGLWNNIQWSGTGTNYNLDDTSKPGWDVSTDSSTGDAYVVRRASAGTNPRALVDLFKVTGASPGSAETAAFLLVNDGAVTSLRRVTVGAIDSGGTGFRLLRVSN
jgi:hypothetical protein